MEKLKGYREKFRTELLNSCVPFWLTHGDDKKHGGLKNCLDRYGEEYSSDKSVWLQGRCAWTYSYIYNHLEQDEKYLAFAKSCLAFLDEHCIDTDGRMFFTVTAEGKKLRKRRYWFSETFYILGHAEYYKATGEKSSLEKARAYFELVWNLYQNPQSDPFKITPKAYAETRATISLACPMILLNVAAEMIDVDAENAERYEERVSVLINDVKKFHSDEYGALLECVTPEGELILDSAPCRIVNPGHDIECSWFLLEAGLRRGDDEVIAFAEKVFWEAFNRGWDEEYGGIFYFKDLLGKPVEAYEHDMKLWWPHNEAVIASLAFYLHTGEKKYLDVFERVTKYAFDKFSDPEFGEWLGYLRRDGKPTEPPCKGHTYKGPFHVMRMLAKCVVLLEKIKKPKG